MNAAIVIFLFVMHQYRSSFHMSRAVTSKQSWGMCGSGGIYQPNDVVKQKEEPRLGVDEQARLDGARMPRYISMRGVHHKTQDKLYRKLCGNMKDCNVVDRELPYSISPTQQFFSTPREHRDKPINTNVKKGDIVKNISACLGHHTSLNKQRRFLHAYDRHLKRVNTALSKNK